MTILEILEKVSKGELKEGSILKSNNEYYADIIICKDNIMFYVSSYNEIETFKISTSDIIGILEDGVIFE